MGDYIFQETTYDDWDDYRNGFRDKRKIRLRKKIKKENKIRKARRR